MLAMTYDVDKDMRQLHVYAVADCPERHTWTIPVPNEVRVELPSQRPKHYYRYAENVLLSLQRIVFKRTKLERKSGSEINEDIRVLACKECEGA